MRLKSRQSVDHERVCKIGAVESLRPMAQSKSVTKFMRDQPLEIGAIDVVFLVPVDIGVDVHDRLADFRDAVVKITRKPVLGVIRNGED